MLSSDVNEETWADATLGVHNEIEERWMQHPYRLAFVFGNNDD